MELVPFNDISANVFGPPVFCGRSGVIPTYGAAFVMLGLTGSTGAVLEVEKVSKLSKSIAVVTDPAEVSLGT